MGSSAGDLAETLGVIIAGFEHSGTTMISEVLRQVPDLDSGFEGGLLLKETPRDFIGFAPFFENLASTWKIPKENLAKLLDTDDFGTAYRRIRQASPVIENKETRLIDKTPRYMQSLKSVLQRAKRIPCVVVVRDPRAIIWSSYRRTGKDLDVWQAEILPITLRHMRSYIRGYLDAVDADAHGRIHLVKYEAFCTDQLEQAHRLFEHCHVQFHPSYLQFGAPKYDLVYGRSVETSYLTDYRDKLPARILDIVRDRFSDMPDWFWTGVSEQ